MSELLRSRNIIPAIALSLLLTGCNKPAPTQEAAQEAPAAPAATAEAFPDPAATATAETTAPDATETAHSANTNGPRERVTGESFKLIGNNVCKIVAGDVGGSGEEQGMLSLAVTLEAHRDPSAEADEDALEGSNGELTVHEEITAHAYTDNQAEAEPVDSVYKDVLEGGSYWTDRTQSERPQLYIYVPEEPADGTKVVVRQTVTYTNTAPEGGGPNGQVTRGCDGMMTFADKATGWEFVPTSPAEVTAPVCQQSNREYEGQPADVRKAACAQ